MKKKTTKSSRSNSKNGKRKKSSHIASEIGREIASAAIGTGTTFGAISGAGVGGFSAAGISSGLAALGVGSMLGGVLVAPALGYGAYRLSKWAFAPSEAFE